MSGKQTLNKIIRSACRTDWWGGCLVSVAVKLESLVWVVAQHFWIPFIIATLMGARPMSRSGQPTSHYCCTLQGQGDTTKLTTTKLYVLIFLIPKAKQMYIWCARLGSSQSVKISDFPHRVWGYSQKESCSAVRMGALWVPDTLWVKKTSIKNKQSAKWTTDGTVSDKKVGGPSERRDYTRVRLRTIYAKTFVVFLCNTSKLRSILSWCARF